MPIYDSKKDQKKGTGKPAQPKMSPKRMSAQQIKGHSYDTQKESLSPRSAPSYEEQCASLKPDLQKIQMKGGASAKDIHGTAAKGVKGGGGNFPHLDSIKKSFGKHDISGVKAHVGGTATEACEELGAKAYTTGGDVAFKGSPDIHTAAHEGAHALHQGGGVNLQGGVGKVGDQYERHADAVADRVVQGKSAEDLLDSAPAGMTDTALKVQFTGYSLDKPLPEGAETPAHVGGREATKQRQYSVEQYLEMWEKEHGRKMTEAEKKTLARGCIGITAVELNAVNPPLDNAYATFDKAYEVMKEWNAFVEKNKNKDAGNGLKIGDYKAVLFAKLFWSNQNPATDLSKPDDKAFRPDPKTGKVDMSNYKYIAQPGYVNFDYGFWDENTQSFWHANHAEPGMKVYQSTKEKFSAGYIDFDRIIFCVAWARNYKPREAARNN